MKNHFLRWPILIFANTLLLALLTACSFGATGGSASTSTTPTTAPTATPTPSPTPESLTIFKGNGFSIGYPQGWTEKDNGQQIVFSDATGTSQFVVGAYPNSGIPISIITNGFLSTIKGASKNYKVENVPATTTVGGATWNQQAASADVSTNGVTVNSKFYILTTTYPANTSTSKSYLIVYDGPSVTFDQTNTDAFQPMLKSFKFTA